MRRSTLLLLAVAALVLAACEIRTDYAMFVDGDSSATLAFEISYDGEAAELFGPAEQFLEQEIEEDVGQELDGVTLLSAEADSSDPENQRVTATFGAEDGEAFNTLVTDLFPQSSFTNTEGDIWVLTLNPDEEVAEEFDDELGLDELPLDFISGEVRFDHDGSQVSMTGGEAGSGNEVVWNPYGAEPLEVIMDLSGATPPAEPEEPAAAEDPEDPEEAEEAAEPEEREEPEEPAEPDQPEEPAAPEDPGDTEGSEDELAAEDGEAAAAVGEDDGGISMLLLAALAGLLLLLLVLVLVLRGRGKDDGGAGQAQQPVAAGATTAAGGWDRQQAAGQWDQTQYGQQPTQQWDQGQAPAAPPGPGGPPPASPQQPGGPPPASPQQPGGPAAAPPPAQPGPGQPPPGPAAPPPSPGERAPGQGDDDRPPPPQPPPPPPAG